MKKITYLCLLLLMSSAVYSQSIPIEDFTEYTKTKMTDLWNQRITGENIALGKVVTFTPIPDYTLTSAGGTDSTDLTDGQIATAHQEIHLFSTSVGWRDAGVPKRLTIDLGSEQPIKEIVWRVSAGSVKRAIRGPKKFVVYGSLDGQAFFKISECFKWREDSQNPENPYLPNIGPIESGSTLYVYPVVLAGKNYRMRYVSVYFEQDDVFNFSDEIAVMKGTGTGTSMTGLPQSILQSSGVWINAPATEEAIFVQYEIPIHFWQSDLRTASAGVDYTFVLPEGVGVKSSYVNQVPGNGTTVTFHAYSGGSKYIGPFFFYLNQNIYPATRTVNYYAKGDGISAQPVHSITFSQKWFNNIPNMTLLSLGIGWMTDTQRRTWLDFSENYKKIGFNTVPAFPRAWTTEIAANGITLASARNSSDPTSLTTWGQEIQSLRNEGFKIVYMESPLHTINSKYSDELDRAEYRCTNSSGEIILPTLSSWCPQYDGTFLDIQLDDLRLYYQLMGGADIVMWDLELFYAAKSSAEYCVHCILDKASYYPTYTWLEYIREKYKGLLEVMHGALVTECNNRSWTMHDLYQYHVDASKIYQDIIDYNTMNIYAGQSSSLYVGNDPSLVNEQIRECRTISNTNKNIPWLTTATSGAVSPLNAKIMMLEALFNGSVGVTYFKFEDFRPYHYWYINKALQLVAADEDIIFYGSPAHSDFTVQQGYVRISAVEHNGYALLLLVSTYDGPGTRVLNWTHTPTGKTGSMVVPAYDAGVVKIDLGN